MMNRLLIISFLFLKIISYGQAKNEDLRQIIFIEASIDGTIKWTAVGENSKLPYVVEQYRWKKWIKIGEIDGRGTSAQTIYSFRAIPYNGKNLCRVKALSDSNNPQEVSWTSEMSSVKFLVNKKASKIEFSDSESRPIETMFEIINSSGTLVKRGWAQYVSFDNLPNGTYTLNYDNTTGEFKK